MTSFSMYAAGALASIAILFSAVPRSSGQNVRLTNDFRPGGGYCERRR
jgi:hypothetical protein